MSRAARRSRGAGIISAALAISVAMASPALAAKKPTKKDGDGEITAPVEPPVPGAIGYTPTDKVERGIWMEMDEYERTLKHGKDVIRDPALNAYVRQVLCNAVGNDKCSTVRLYLIRTPHFNASMAPNGMMLVWSGLLMRMRDEAQLAAVLGHEFGHFERQHSLRQMKRIRDNLTAAAWASIFIGDLATLAALNSIFSYSRQAERDADHASIDYLAKSPYPTVAASQIWLQLREEQDATAKERKHRSRKNETGGMFATHPNTAERHKYLAKRAAETFNPTADARRKEYREALRTWWPTLIDDQVKLFDFGATEFLLANLATEGWTSDLLFARGELYRSRAKPGDFDAAAGFYRDAIAKGDALPETWRGLGLSLMRAGQPDAGKAALAEYLQRKPDAGDAAMIQIMAK